MSEMIITQDENGEWVGYFADQPVVEFNCSSKKLLIKIMEASR